MTCIASDALDWKMSLVDAFLKIESTKNHQQLYWDTLLID
jgi:hypothetical protein